MSAKIMWGFWLRRRAREAEKYLLMLPPDERCIPDYDHEAGKDGRCIWCNAPLDS